MHHNQSGIYTNNLSSHASLLLSASPTIVTSPLQNNSNNPKNPPLPSPVPAIRRQSSAPLLPADNLDLDAQTNNASPSNSCPQEGFINFKKPQNEIFKKIDGKIQKIVAAHSNLNKLYALNDFSGLHSGTKRPFELPAQLPPPPPWVPKPNSDNQDNTSQEDDRKQASTRVVQRVRSESPKTHTNIIKPGSSLISQSFKMSDIPNNSSPKSTNFTIDSAITKLHQRRQQREQFQQSLQKPAHQSMQQRREDFSNKFVTNIRQASKPANPPIPSSSKTLIHNINPATFALMAQKIKEALETDPSKTQNESLASEDRKKFQENLINLLKKEISVVAKSAKLKFSTPPKNPPKQPEQKSLLLKSSPQTIFNTIRRETSLLLSQKDSSGRSTLSILPSQINNGTRFQPDINNLSSRQQGFNKVQNTIKVVIPPSEQHFETFKKSDTLTKTPDKSYGSTRSQLSYQVIRNKFKTFQENNRVSLAKPPRPSLSSPHIYPSSKKICPQRSLDKIVDRLQARCSSVASEFGDFSQTERKPTLHEQIISSSASLLRSSQVNLPSSISAIPVFRSPLISSTKSSYLNTNGALKSLGTKSRKHKHNHHLGLRISSYLDNECPQPSQETITIEEYARGLNLVRTNDISLQRHKEKLLQSEIKWKMPIGNRPLRLRRIRGERIHMPPSASYKAASKVGLQ